MTHPQREHRIKELFNDAIELDQSERAEFLDRAPDDDSLRTYVRHMIDAHERAGDFLADPHVNGADMPLPPGGGEMIGRYRLLKLLGEGGFGSVYLARQQEPVVRDVALKIIRTGMDTRQVIARFEAERQALAVMEHPNIARVIDAGATAAGRPYFVMELVDGVPVTTYCDEHRLSIAARLELFCNVCEAVHHAHTKGVIHRDIKPSNVLVAQQDHRHVPKVIDFGIAKATTGIGNVAESSDRPAPAGFRFTMDYGLIGTPAYMSPEQAAPGAPGASDIDTRTDVYSLGVLLYELLISVTPFDEERLRSSTFDEIQRILREEAPPNPSTRFSRLQSSAEAAAHRSVAPHCLARTLYGDLDWIALKALNKDRDRRYASAAEFAEDLRRYLRHEPVIAGPPSALYKVKKFARRNRFGVLASCLVGLAVLAGVVGLTVGMVKARQSADQAHESANHARDAALQAQAVNDFMREVLTSVSPDSKGADVRLVDVMEDASAVASQRFVGQPELEAQVRLLLSTVFLHLDIRRESIKEADMAATLLESIHGRNDPRALRARLVHLQTLLHANRTRDAETALANLAPRISADEANPMAMEIALFTAGVLRLRGRLDQAEAILRELQRRLPVHGAEDTMHLHVLDGLIGVLLARQDASSPNHLQLCREIEMLAQEMKDRADQQGRAESIPALRARVLMADMMVARGEFAGAADLCRDVLATSEARFGRCHIQRQMAMSVLADALNRLDDSAGAAEVTLQIIECAKMQNESLQLIVRIMEGLPLLERGGRWAEGESFAREYRNVLEQMGGGHGDMRLYGDLFIARFVSLQGRFEESGPLLQALLAREHEADDDQTRARLHMCWGSDLARQGLYQQAEQSLLAAADRLGDVHRGTSDKTPDDLIGEFIALYRAWGRPELADEYEAMRKQTLGSLPVDSS